MNDPQSTTGSFTIRNHPQFRDPIMVKAGTSQVLVPDLEALDWLYQYARQHLLEGRTLTIEGPLVIGRTKGDACNG